MESFLRLILKLGWIGAILGATTVTILSLIASAARYWWVGKLLNHPRPQYTLILVLCLPLVVWRFGRTGWLILIPLLLNFIPFASLYLKPQYDPSSTPQLFKALHYNLDNTLPDHDAAFAYLRDHPVDILSLQEFTPKDADQLQQELPGYDIVYSHPMTNSHGSVLLVSTDSGIQVRSAGIIHLPQDSVRPIIEADLDIQGHSFAFLSFHTIRPANAGNTAFQEAEFATAAEWSRQHQERGQAVLIMGDFNITSWSTNFRQFQQDGHLLNSEQGYGLQPTWPAGLPSAFRIPIDHCLYSREIIIVDRSTGPFLGSDHAPLHIQFAFDDNS